MDGETPSWLEGDSASPAPTPVPVPEPTSQPEAFDLNQPAPSSEKTARAPTTTDNVAGSIMNTINTASDKPEKEVDESDLPRVIFIMRLLNLAAAGLLIAVSIVQLVGLPHISVWIMALYATFGGVLVCCLETQLKFIRTSIAMNFGFLFNSVYRFLFYCLMASVSWGYTSLLGKITAIVLGVTAVFNTFVICRYPSYRKQREKIAAEEDKRIQAKINQQVRKQAFSQMGWGGSK
eukprot:scaffold650_cov127-Skeletonema_marinoi.AAC.5